MKSFIINLPFRGDRLLRLNYDLIKNYTIIEAVHFISLTQEEKNNYIEKIYTTGNRIDRPGSMGCFLSHYKVLDLVANQNEYDYVYVFEDDVNIINENEFKNVENKLPKSFDILMLGGIYGDETKANSGFYIPDYGKNASCTEAYIVSKKGAKKIIEYINKKQYTSMNIDWYYHNLGRKGAIEYFCHEPLLTTQNHSDTNIQV